MDKSELLELGRAIARDIAAGLMAGVAAGSAEFGRTMAEVRREAVADREAADADCLTQLADRLEAKREELRGQIAGAKGLKRVALKRRLKQLDDAEAAMVAEATKPAKASAAPKAIEPATQAADEHLTFDDHGPKSSRLTLLHELDSPNGHRRN